MKLTTLLPVAFILGLGTKTAIAGSSAPAGIKGTYDCRRKLPPCAAGQGTCNKETGACDCTYSWGSIDCTQDGSQSGCNDTSLCQNNQRCQQASGVDTCYCDGAFEGPTCANERYSLTCNTSTTPPVMSMKLFPWGGTSFNGTVYGHLQSGCVSDAGTPSTGLEYTHILNNNACGSTNGQGPSYSRKILIQYDPDTLKASDELLTFVCGPDTIIKTATVGATGIIDGNINEDLEIIGAEDADAEIEVYDGALSDNTTVGSTAKDIGNKITLALWMTALGQAKYAAFMVQVCTASNMATDDLSGNYKSTDLVDSTGCTNAVPLQEHILTDVLTDGSSGKKYVEFLLFQFTNINTLYLSCTVKFCIAGSAAGCNQCPPASMYRKKRDAGTETTNTTSLHASIKIRDTFTTDSAGQDQDGVQKSDNCSVTSETTATVAALSAATLILLCICIFLVFRTILNRDKKKSKKPEEQ